MTQIPEDKLNEAAIKYAINHSAAPDRETPDWIITDFKAGAEWAIKEFAQAGKVMDIKDAYEQYNAYLNNGSNPVRSFPEWIKFKGYKILDPSGAVKPTTLPELLAEHPEIVEKIFEAARALRATMERVTIGGKSLLAETTGSRLKYPTFEDYINSLKEKKYKPNQP